MADDSWRDTYDSWKLASPYDSDEPEPQTDPGECELCRGSGVIGSTARGRFLGAGPLPYPPPAGVYEATCPGCGGTGEILAETDGEPNMDNNTQPDWPGVLAAHEAETAGMTVIGDPSGIVRRVPVHYAGLIACAIRCRLRGLDMPSEAGGMAVDQPQQNGAYGAHQFRIRLPGDHGNAYRVIIAPADAPISIGGVPANEHFAEPITGGE